MMKIHFVGIGGIGVSALAGFYLEKGNSITGSDLASSEITDVLRKQGVKIKIGKHKSVNLPKDTDLVVYSPAVEKNNPELKETKKLGIKCLSYPEALGELTKKYFTIAVSGAHGKSTTTAMIALVLEKAGLDPNVIVGTKMKDLGGKNYRAGGSNCLVIEADEWNASFLNYWPKIIVLTNIEREHLDYYKNLNNILRTFSEYVSHLPRGGTLVLNLDDDNIRKMLISNFQFPNSRLYNYTLANQGSARRQVLISNQISIKKFSNKQKEVTKLRKILKVPGEHNISNALAALAVARILKIPDEISFKALSEFTGTWRRFDVRKEKIGRKEFTLISDYGHHPTEIKATLQAAREKFPKKKIWCVFQPHQYQRTFYLFGDFVKVFRQAPAEKIIITDIYSVAGREKGVIKKKVSSQKLVKAIAKEKVIYLPKKKIKDYLEKNLEGEEVVIIMGAGDIYELSRSL